MLKQSLVSQTRDVETKFGFFDGGSSPAGTRVGNPVLIPAGVIDYTCRNDVRKKSSIQHTALDRFMEVKSNSINVAFFIFIFTKLRAQSASRSHDLGDYYNCTENAIT